jgi:hypothetical protein
MSETGADELDSTVSGRVYRVVSAVVAFVGVVADVVSGVVVSTACVVSFEVSKADTVVVARVSFRVGAGVVTAEVTGDAVDSEVVGEAVVAVCVVEAVVAVVDSAAVDSAVVGGSTTPYTSTP